MFLDSTLNLDSIRFFITNQMEATFLLNNFEFNSVLLSPSENIYSTLAPSYRVLAPDLLGRRSNPPKCNYMPQDYIQVIKAFWSQICPIPPIVVASSLVAAIAIKLDSHWGFNPCTIPSGLRKIDDHTGNPAKLAEQTAVTRHSTAVFWS